MSDFAGDDGGALAEEAGVRALADGADDASGLVAERAGKRNAPPEDALHNERVVMGETARLDAQQRLAGAGRRVGEQRVAQGRLRPGRV